MLSNWTHTQFLVKNVCYFLTSQTWRKQSCKGLTSNTMALLALYDSALQSVWVKSTFMLRLIKTLYLNQCRLWRSSISLSEKTWWFIQALALLEIPRTFIFCRGHGDCGGLQGRGDREGHRGRTHSLMKEKLPNPSLPHEMHEENISLCLNSLPPPWRCSSPGLMGLWATCLVEAVHAHGKGWNYMTFKDPSNPNHSMNLWFYSLEHIRKVRK